MDFINFSNGNTHYLNGGLNVIGGRIGVVCTFGATDDVAGTMDFKQTFIVTQKLFFIMDKVVQRGGW